VVLSDFQPWLFGSATVLAAGCAGAWRVWPPSGATRGARAASVFGLGVVILLAGGLLFPALAMGGAEAWGWLARTDHFQGLVAESQPLFMARGEISLMAAAANLSIFLFAMPIALVAGVVAARRRAHPEALLLLLGWTFVVCLAAVMQRRFANSASVVVALALAVSVVALYDRLVGRGSATSARRMAAGALAALICGAALLPVWVIYAPFLQHYTSEHGRVVLRGDHYNRYAMMETAAWLGRHTPPTRGWLDASVQPEYAILAPWVMGHVIEYVARRPTTTNNFGDDIGSGNFLSAQAYYAADEARASELLDRLDVRYVVVPFRVGFLAERPPPASMYHALFGHDGARFTPRGAAPGKAVPALERHRLIFEFSRTNRDEGRRPTYKVFEYVRGARLRGRSSPGAEIHAELSLETREGRSFVYSARATVAGSGRFVLRVPYASGIQAGAVTSADHYVVRCESEPAEIRPPAREVFVDESDVVRGKLVRVPDPCANGF
jgi:asparagine N-glycosylation enzyme membrane subunit Stt3